ncbi:hypothetical protein TVAG_372710 [Trichomonas vaginalis G3]|uniref:Right handed beta helix domain-containing protein n=1 Tax=Trichomonas vaginalis (strain ATCC PRA-98 / G3) TaxID=412133 RepID=A2EZ14_TRIV3|nr:hypothetical protein TVAGG3_0372980 [Trichomonas vaginalis G3]EAY02126.1 hypothetical protein TVAG_372710 [Trichomonas vaginalis G3]KAI5532729.1 hypothetical protein TVAGG3_0372980 [Trichomonas vaginalis G3]|eukprot:XP_001330546.1 hypothetical protein [Trichomonas vaginalis G3]
MFFDFLGSSIIRKDWSNYYSGVPIIYNSSTSTWDGNYYVVNNEFENLSQKALQISASSNTKVLVEYCFFYSISSSGYGGVIYLGSAGEYVGAYLCASKCKCDSFGHFSLTWTNDDKNAKNWCIQNSCSNCGTYGVGYCTEIMDYGDGKFANSNLSSCQSEDRCAYINEQASNITDDKFCQIANNTASSSYVVKHYTGCQRNMRYMNIVNNHIANYIIYSEQATVVITNCSLIDNSATDVFYNSGGSFTVITTYLENSGTISNDANTISISTSYFQLKLSFYGKK